MFWEYSERRESRRAKTEAYVRGKRSEDNKNAKRKRRNRKS